MYPSFDLFQTKLDQKFFLLSVIFSKNFNNLPTFLHRDSRTKNLQIAAYESRSQKYTYSVNLAVKK
jgi:hypothetical protein